MLTSARMNKTMDTTCNMVPAPLATGCRGLAQQLLSPRLPLPRVVVGSIIASSSPSPPPSPSSFTLQPIMLLLLGQIYKTGKNFNKKKLVNCLQTKQLHCRYGPISTDGHGICLRGEVIKISPLPLPPCENYVAWVRADE